MSLDGKGDKLQAAGKQMSSCGGTLTAIGCSGFLLLVVVLIVVSLLSGGHSDPPAATASTEERATAVASTSAPATAAKTAAPASTPGVTGFGAADGSWDEAHTEDTNYAHEAAYDTNPSLPENDGHPGDEYTDVKHGDGHVTGYEYHFQSESATEARSAILAEQFPPDATVVGYKELATCAVMLVKSAAVAPLLGLPEGTPVAQLELETGSEASGHEETLDPSSVDGALITEGYPGIEGLKDEC